MLGTVTLALIVVAAVVSGPDQLSRAATGVCGVVGSAFEIVGGALCVSTFEGTAWLLHRV